MEARMERQVRNNFHGTNSCVGSIYKRDFFEMVLSSDLQKVLSFIFTDCGFLLAYLSVSDFTSVYLRSQE